jgi:hypothetical protein
MYVFMTGFLSNGRTVVTCILCGRAYDWVRVSAWQ